MRSSRFLVLVCLGLVIGACSAGGSTGGKPGAAGTSGAAGTTGAAGVTGASGASGGAGAGAGAGTTGQAGTTAPLPDAGAAGNSTPLDARDEAPAGGPGAAGAGVPDAAVEVPAGGCPASAICDDFESYAAGATDLAPRWTVYKYGGGALQVDATKPFRGGKSLHVTVPAGGRKYADIIKETVDDSAVLPLKHYGRVMVWITNMPSAAHWAINQAGGILSGTTDMTAKYSWGGQNAKLLPGYSQRSRVIGGATPLRGGGPQDGDPNPAPVDCSMPAKTQTVATKKWVCWEWMVDGATPEVHMWLDGQPQTEVDVVGKGTACATGPKDGTWTAPKAFSKIILGWEGYTQASEVPNDVWLDDLVMGPERVGCPAP
jgi:hypothetical protein